MKPIGTEQAPKTFACKSKNAFRQYWYIYSSIYKSIYSTWQIRFNLPLLQSLTGIFWQGMLYVRLQSVLRPPTPPLKQFSGMSASRSDCAIYSNKLHYLLLPPNYVWKNLGRLWLAYTELQGEFWNMPIKTLHHSLPHQPFAGPINVQSCHSCTTIQTMHGLSGT